MKTRRLARVFVGLLLLVGGSVVCAQVASSQKADDRATSPQNTAPEGSPDSQAPSSYSPPPGQYERAVAYSRAHYRHLMIGSLWGIVVPLLILRWHLAPKYRGCAERASSRRFLQVLVYAPLLLLSMAVLGIPIDAWDHSLARAFGLSIQRWRSWLGDWITNQIIAVILGTLLVWILYAVMRRSPRRWWFYFWLAAIPIVVAVFFIQPLVIDPVFFKFNPLQATQPELVNQLEEVVHRGGMVIPPERMFEMNASSKLTGLNAYVTGFGASKRAVIWDTTIQKSTTPEVLFVFGHEMGHYVLHHIQRK